MTADSSLGIGRIPVGHPFSTAHFQKSTVLFLMCLSLTQRGPAALSVRAYNLGNLWRLVLPARIDTWSLTSLQHRLVKTGRRLVKHTRDYWLLPAESHLTRRLFGSMLQRILALPVPTG